MNKRYIPVYSPEIGEEEINSVVSSLKGGWISSKGPFVKEFEDKFASWLGVKHAISCSNGTVALQLALLSLDIKNSDEVIVPDFTFIATANAVKHVGAKPVFVDIEKESLGIDPLKIEEKITNKTKAIIPVHIYGHPANMDEIMEIAEKHDLYIIEDSAEAIGSEYKGKKTGTLGTISTFSFYGNKVITTGEGGMVVSNDAELIERCYILKEHGMSKTKRYWHDVVGYNYRMTSLQAAFGLAQLKKIDKIINKKREIAKMYIKLLSNESQIKFLHEPTWGKSVYWMNSILLPNGNYRDQIMQDLEHVGIETRPFFYPIHRMPPYLSNERFEVSEDISSRGINLPSSHTLSMEEIEYITNNLIEIVNNHYS